MQIDLGKTWDNTLLDEYQKDYLGILINNLKKVYPKEKIFPPQKLIFNAFKLCPFDEVKVVILGQDPYHAAGQAHGLAFSVPDGTKIPPSLRNIYKEIARDIGKIAPESGNLERWAKQGVLLLNSTLTVEESKPGSHQGLGWETFTDAVIKSISDNKENVVFILWGAFAISKATLIDESKHLILSAPHPSPLSAHRGFLGCRHFSQTNEYFKKHLIKEIRW